jgi:hypothetical protein
VSDDLSGLAADAYWYGFPLTFDLQMARGEAEMGLVTPAPFNTFSHAARLAGPDDRFVSINNDTIYSIAQVDVSGGPVLLRVPDTGGRYYVLQFVDAWTNNPERELPRPGAGRPRRAVGQPRIRGCLPDDLHRR